MASDFQRPLIHGWIVGLGVHLLSRLQENSHAEAVDFMNRMSHQALLDFFGGHGQILVTDCKVSGTNDDAIH